MKQIMEVAGIQVQPGELKLGKMVAGYQADSSAVNIPLLLMNGAEEGPTLLLTCAMHGNEITGIEVVRRLLRELIDPKTLKGSIIAVPVCNPFAFNAGRMNTPLDGLNINRVFPGSPDSILTYQVAYKIYNELAAKADFIIDFHANPSPAMEFTIVKEGKDKKAFDKALEMADAFGITTVEMLSQYENHRGGTLVEAAGNDGKPCIIIELISWRRIEDESVQTGIRGTLNVMKYLGMLEGEIEKQQIAVIPGRLTRSEINSDKGGMVHAFKGLGEAIKKGEKIGVMRDPWGDVVEDIVSPVDGFVLAWPFLENQCVGSGEMMIMLVFPKE